MATGNLKENETDSVRQLLIPKNYEAELTEKPEATSNDTGKVAAIEPINKSNFKKKLEELKDQLQIALELEHSTIPPYLCALYSIRQGSNLMATEIIKSVVLEEMLHMIMVANVLNAIGGNPQIGEKEVDKKNKFIPAYPTSLPGNVDPTLIVGLEPFSKHSIRTFWKIEHPVGNFQLPQNMDTGNVVYKSIGEFYKALVYNLTELEMLAQADGDTIFKGKKEKQVTSQHYYGSGGKLFTVENLEDALNVIEEIVGQGEGTLGSIFTEPFQEGNENYLIFGTDVEDFAHYFRFKEVYYEHFYSTTDSAHRKSKNKGLPTGEKFEVDWEAVYNMKPNIKMKDVEKGSPLHDKMYDFNKTYSALLDNINDACNGKPEILQEGIVLMYQLKYKAVELMNIPIGEGFMAGPSFEYIKG